MMAPEPLRSAMTIGGGAEDTSLALPSDRQLRSGQQRVLDQVHTIKRSRSRHGKTGSLSPSPTSPAPQALAAYSEFVPFKFAPSKANGTFSRSISSTSTGYYKAMNTQKSRSLSTKTIGGTLYGALGTWEKQISSSKRLQGPNGLKPSQSDPALVPPFSSALATRAKGQTSQGRHTIQTRINRGSSHFMTNGTQMTNSQIQAICPPSAQSQTDGKIQTGITIPDMTLKEAVEYLSLNENFQQYGATFIQHITFREECAKQEVFELGGIRFLVALLKSPNPGVSQAAAGALRNLVFKHQNNKLEVQHCGGIGKALQLLKETDSTETRKQITGLLWNLSSADELKGELTVTALPALTENVVVPFTCWSDNSANNNIHPDVFYNATGCLRNLSCAQQSGRQAMRDCHGLIDSLMSYVQSCAAEENPDDKSVENCACILHNLTYQLETESPQCFMKYYPKTEEKFGSAKSPTVGCFSPKSSKAQKQFSFDVDQVLPEDSNPSGEKWLCHPKAMQTYLFLLGTSQNNATLEASCGALQNLTASKGPGSIAISKILVQKLGALLQVSPLLKSHNASLQKTAMFLLNNMSRTISLQTSLAKKILPELTSLLSLGPREMGKCDDTIATACNTAGTLMLADSEISKKAISSELVTSLADLSENGSFPKGSRAASLLLYSIWNEKNLQGVVKKLGLAKSLFVNENTTAVHKSVQIIE